MGRVDRLYLLGFCGLVIICARIAGWCRIDVVNCCKISIALIEGWVKRYCFPTTSKRASWALET